MITIKKINIAFDEVILQDACLEIPDGKVTVI